MSKPHRLRPVRPADSSLSPQSRRFLWIFSVAMVLVAGSSFFIKLIEFYTIATSDNADALASFLLPVFNYMMVAGGFLCLFFWAYSKGHFRDLEAPKYRMLELNREFDRMESEQ